MDNRIPYFEILENALDPTRVPFTERGSRILVQLSRRGDLEVRMAERWRHVEKTLGSHRVRPSLIEGLRPVDGSGHSLPFKLVTWPHKLLLQTSVGNFEVVFANRETLYVCLPKVKCGLSFSVMAERFLPDQFGGVFEGVRDLAMTSNIAPSTLQVTAQAEGRLLMRLDNPDDMPSVVAIHVPQSIERPKALEPVETVNRRAEQSWERWFDAAPRVNRRYWQPYYLAWMVLRNGLLSPAGYLKREALVPSKTHYVGVWHWDAYFHALAYRHVDTQMAQDQLWAMLDHQLDNGLIPDVVQDEALIVGDGGLPGRDLTKPPLMAWAAIRLFESGSGSGFLRDIYEPLVRWNNWWLERCDDDGDGIVQYNHPCSSGLDDSPLWDAGMPVESPDLNTYLSVHMQSLAKIARVIGRHEEAQNWDRKARELAARTNDHFYDHTSGIFWATKEHSRIQVITPFNLLPIWTGYLASHQVRSVVTNLTNQQIFWTEFGIPTVSLRDSNYDPERMWRGPTWINVNYMLIEALSRVGHYGLASTLVDRTIELVARRGVAEYFNSATGEVPAKAALAFGWSAALFVDLLVRRTGGHWQRSGLKSSGDRFTLD